MNEKPLNAAENKNFHIEHATRSKYDNKIKLTEQNFRYLNTLMNESFTTNTSPDQTLIPYSLASAGRNLTIGTAKRRLPSTLTHTQNLKVRPSVLALETPFLSFGKFG